MTIENIAQCVSGGLVYLQATMIYTHLLSRGAKRCAEPGEHTPGEVHLNAL